MWLAPLFDYAGQDQGQFAGLRRRFVERVRFPEGAKAPPAITHSSLARFVPPAMPLGAAERCAAAHPLRFTQHITGFRLLETRREPMREFTVLRSFPLGAP